MDHYCLPAIFFISNREALLANLNLFDRPKLVRRPDGFLSASIIVRGESRCRGVSRCLLLAVVYCWTHKCYPCYCLQSKTNLQCYSDRWFTVLAARLVALIQCLPCHLPPPYCRRSLLGSTCQREWPEIASSWAGEPWFGHACSASGSSCPSSSECLTHTAGLRSRTGLCCQSCSGTWDRSLWGSWASVNLLWIGGPATQPPRACSEFMLWFCFHRVDCCCRRGIRSSMHAGGPWSAPPSSDCTWDPGSTLNSSSAPFVYWVARSGHYCICSLAPS